MQDPSALYRFETDTHPAAARASVLLVAVAKALRDFSRANPLLVVKSGYFDGAPLSADEVTRLADLESREVLLAERAYGDLLERLRPAQRASEPVVAIGWMLEELRVSLFANRLGTADPVSVKRIQRAIAAVPTD